MMALPAYQYDSAERIDAFFRGDWDGCAGIRCACGSTTANDLSVTRDHAAGLFGPSHCGLCGQSLTDEATMSAFRVALREYEIPACDACGVRLTRHGYCDACVCPCCSGHRNGCGCEIVEGRNGYGCATHHRGVY